MFNNPFLDWQYLALFWSSAPAKCKIDRKLNKMGVFGPPSFNGESTPKFWTKFLKLHLYPNF